MASPTPIAYRHMKEKTMAIQYMVNLETCPDGATRAAIVELRQVVDLDLGQELATLTGNISSEPSAQEDGAEPQETPTKRRRPAKKAGA